MRSLAAWMFVLNALHLVVASTLATSTGFTDVPIYRFTIPHLTLVALTLLVLSLGALRRPLELLIVVIMAVALSATLITAMHAASKWPGGNDGPGIAWFYFIGGLSAINGCAAVVFGVAAFRNRLRSRP